MNNSYPLVDDQVTQLIIALNKGRKLGQELAGYTRAELKQFGVSPRVVARAVKLGLVQEHLIRIDDSKTAQTFFCVKFYPKPESGPQVLEAEVVPPQDQATTGEDHGRNAEVQPTHGSPSSN